MKYEISCYFGLGNIFILMFLYIYVVHNSPFLCVCVTMIG